MLRFTCGHALSNFECHTDMLPHFTGWPNLCIIYPVRVHMTYSSARQDDGQAINGKERRTLLKVTRCKRRQARGLQVKRYPSTPNLVPPPPALQPPLSYYTVRHQHPPNPTCLATTVAPSQPALHPHARCHNWQNMMDNLDCHETQSLRQNT